LGASRRSKPEQKVWKALSDSACLSSGFLTQEQVGWKKLFPNLLRRGESRNHVDFYLPTFQVIIEVQGAHHYKPVHFGGDKQKILAKFERQAKRDRRLKGLAKATARRVIELEAATLPEHDELVELLNGLLL